MAVWTAWARLCAARPRRCATERRVSCRPTDRRAPVNWLRAREARPRGVGGVRARGDGAVRARGVGGVLARGDSAVRARGVGGVRARGVGGVLARGDSAVRCGSRRPGCGETRTRCGTVVGAAGRAETALVYYVYTDDELRCLRNL